MKTRYSLFLATTIFVAGAFLQTLEAATTVGYTNITPTSDLIPETGFSLAMIADGDTGTMTSLNGFVSNSFGTISFTFDQDYDLRSFLLWNDVVVNYEGINDFSLRFFDSSDTAITIPFSANYVGPVGKLDAEEYIFPSAVTGVRRVELEVTSAQSPSFPIRIEIREVDFGVVPEPSSTFFLAGAGLLGLTFFRRRPRKNL